jgi:hypothetical protein
MRTALFISVMGFALMISVFGASLDLLIIDAGCKIPSGAKIMGNAMELFFIWLCIYLVYVLFAPVIINSGWASALMVVNTLFAWWVFHDMVIGSSLGVGVDYIGQGNFDQFFGRIFQQSGWLYIGARLFLLLLGSLTYFSITKTKTNT